jgi:hypothetical protein
MAVEQTGLFELWLQWNHRVADCQLPDIFTVRDNYVLKYANNLIFITYGNYLLFQRSFHAIFYRTLTFWMNHGSRSGAIRCNSFR